MPGIAICRVCEGCLAAWNAENETASPSPIRPFAKKFVAELSHSASDTFRYIAIHEICQVMSSPISRALTGYDNTSFIADTDKNMRNMRSGQLIPASLHPSATLWKRLNHYPQTILQSSKNSLCLCIQILAILRCEQGKTVYLWAVCKAGV